MRGIFSCVDGASGDCGCVCVVRIVGRAEWNSVSWVGVFYGVWIWGVGCDSNSLGAMGSDGGAPAEVSGGADSVAERVADLAKECRALQETVSEHTARWHAESDVLSKQAVALVAAMKELERDVYAASERNEISHYVAEMVPFRLPLLLFHCPHRCPPFGPQRTCRRHRRIASRGCPISLSCYLILVPG